MSNHASFGLALLLSLTLLGAAMPAGAAVDPATIPDSNYVIVKDGHLSLNGQRVRYWGWIGHFNLEGKLNEFRVKAGDSPEVKAAKIKKTREVYDALAQRIADLGFNMVRWWGVGDWRNPDYTVGDGSDADLAAFALAALEKRGIRVWMTAFNDFGRADAEADASIIDDPATAAAWTAAVKALGRDTSPRKNDIGAWDPRMRAVHLRRMKEIADWPNHYKNGLRLGDDPQMAVWELTNEEWMYSHMVNGQWQSLPQFFRDELMARWSGFLKAKYGDDKALTKAWGFLLPGESMQKNSVLLLPLAKPNDGKAFNDANPAAIAALTASKQKLSRDDFTRRRGEDVMAFLFDVQLKYKVDRRDYAKTLGKSLKLSPLVLDTGPGHQIQSILLHQQGDASTMCTYLWQTATDRQQPRFPFISGLEETPRLAMGIPWVEIGRVPGKPFFVYEFQTNNPDMYRAEVPYRIAALGAIQDWDIINFHLFGRPNDPAEESPYSKPINYSHSGNNGSIEGVHFKNDEIYASAMKAAGAFFIHGSLKPVENPTVMTFGRESLYDPKSADYGGSFGDLSFKITPTAWRYGLYMQVDPEAEKDVITGPVVERGLNEACPIKPTDQITFDWQQSFMKFDAPAGVSWTGFFAKQTGPVRFDNGIALADVQVINDEGVNYPVTKDQLYVSFSAVADDGKPLAESKKVIVSLVSTSFNWGFKINEENVARGDLGYTGKPFEGQVNAQGEKGKPPVAYARAGAVVTTGPLKGMKYTMMDWALRPIGQGVVGETLTIPADKPVFYIELTR